MNPLWLLDVDGVLNAVTSDPDGVMWREWKQAFAEAQGRRWPICYAPAVTERIAALHNNGQVEVRWLTTWRHDANASLRHVLDLPELTVVADASGPIALTEGEASSHGAAVASAYGAASGWWKLDALRQLIAREGGERPLVWTDDELAYRTEAVAWVRTNVRESLLISPVTSIGLTPRHLDEITEFCAAHTD
jgi:hypothetical protein